MIQECQQFQDFEEEAIHSINKRFSERIGVSKVNSLTDVAILESSIRDDLNKLHLDQWL